MLIDVVEMNKLIEMFEQNLDEFMTLPREVVIGQVSGVKKMYVGKIVEVEHKLRNYDVETIQSMDKYALIICREPVQERVDALGNMMTKVYSIEKRVGYAFLSDLILGIFAESDKLYKKYYPSLNTGLSQIVKMS